MGIDAQIAYITNGYGKVQPLEEINVDTGRKKMSSYSVDYSANYIANTTTSNSKCDQTDGKSHPDYGIPLNYNSQNEAIVITPDAVFIKPLKLVVITEDVYNKLIPIEWIEKKLYCCDNINAEIFVKALIREWENNEWRQ